MVLVDIQVGGVVISRTISVILFQLVSTKKADKNLYNHHIKSMVRHVVVNALTRHVLHEDMGSSPSLSSKVDALKGLHAIDFLKK